MASVPSVPMLGNCFHPVQQGMRNAAPTLALPGLCMHRSDSPTKKRRTASKTSCGSPERRESKTSCGSPVKRRLSDAPTECKSSGEESPRKKRCSLYNGAPLLDERSSFLEDVLDGIWLVIARYSCVADMSAVLCSSTRMNVVFENNAIWQQHALIGGLAQLILPAEHADGGWVYPFAPEVEPDRIVDWRQLLKINVQMRDQSAIWVRVRDVDLRMPMKSSHADSTSALLRVLRFVVRTGPTTQQRLRSVQWNGRPGPVHGGVLPVGIRLMLEWTSPCGTWPLPGNDLSVYTARAGAEQGPAVQHALLHIRTTLVATDVWLTIDLASTLCALYKAVLYAFCLKTSNLEALLAANKLQPWLLGATVNGKAARTDPAKPLRDLGWMQSESLHAELRHSDSVPGYKGNQCFILALQREEVALASPGMKTSFASASSSMSRKQRWPLAPPGCVGVKRALAICGSSRHDGHLSWFQQDTSSMRPSVGVEPFAEEEPPLPWKVSSVSSSSSADSPSSRSTDVCMPAKHTVDELAPPAEISDGSSTSRTSELSRGEAVSSTAALHERLVPHYTPRVVPGSVDTRQFEFHPSHPDLLLVGDRKGRVNVLNCEADEGDAHPALQVDTCPMLGLVWMKHHPQTAVCGSASSGKMSFLHYDPNARSSKPVLKNTHNVEDFPNLTSLDMNCTDDFLLATGLSRNLAIYDAHTGQISQVANGVHDHFINIGRFCNGTPHIFATASFDNTCRIWDLRQPLVKERCVKTLNTDGRNVMCTFSPDDTSLLCSGVDTRLHQFDVPSWRRSPDKFALREPMHQGRYRRSIYLVDSPYVVTAATEESHLRLLSRYSGDSLGVVDFQGVIRNHLQRQQPVDTVHVPWWRSFIPGTADESDQDLPCQLRHGEVQVEDSSPGTATSGNRDFVQSIRAHHHVKNRIGVLLCRHEAQSKESAIALVHVDPKAIGWKE